MPRRPSPPPADAGPRLRAVRLALLFAASLTVVPAAGAETSAHDSAAGASEATCAAIYHAALSEIARTHLPEIDAARSDAREGDDALPGRWIVPPPQVRRSTEEMAALRQAAGLMRGKGRSSWLGDRDQRWIADRLRTDLRAYLTQDPSSYLCGGVSHYLGVLRSYWARLGGRSPDTSDAVAIETAATRAAIRDALAAMKPAPIPRFAERDGNGAPTAMDGTDSATQLAGLRPAQGLATRREQPVAAAAKASAAEGPNYDPDVPPLAARPPLPLATDADRLAAIESLIAAAQKAGFLPQGGDGATAGAEGPQVGPVPGRPVLDALDKARPLVISAGAPIRDPLVRLRLVEALSDIEALDYLVRGAKGGSPYLDALRKTFDAIETVHRRARRGDAGAAVAGAVEGSNGD